MAEKLKASKKRLLIKPIEFSEKAGAVIIPEKFAAPYGRGRTGIPHLVGEILSIGEGVHIDAKVGDVVLINGLGAELMKMGEDKYYCPGPKALMAVLEKS